MHQPIRDSLEEYLAGALGPQEQRNLEAHLASCSECRKKVEEIEQQSGMFQALRPSEVPELDPSFYARVIDRIDNMRVPSFWSLLLEPAFAKRLVYSSLLLLVLLGGLLMTTPAGNMTPAHTPESILAGEQYPPAHGGVDHDRDVVLVNLATYSD
jgi:anti-sigma factor RsiW